MKLNFKLMRKSIPIIEKRLLRFYSKPLLTLFAILIMATTIFAQTGTIVEDCTCLSNNSCEYDGQFSTLIRITNGGAGPWYIAQDSIRGLYKNPSPAPPAQPDEFTTGPGGDQMDHVGNDTFELSGIHIDGLGYWVQLTDGQDTLEFKVDSAHCQYPHTNIVGDPFVCEGQESSYTTQNNAGSSYNWTLNNGGAFTSTTNTNTVTVQWDDDSDGSVHQLIVDEVSVHGCIISDTMDVIIEDTITLACNDDVQISLDVNCAGELTADMFLEDPQYNDDSYQLIIEDENGIILNQDTLSSDMVGKRYTVTVQHICSSNMCWSHMLVLDKTAPEVECKSDTIKCSDPIKPQDLDMYPIVNYTSIETTSNPYVYIAKGTPGCSDLTMTYFDEVEDEDCNSNFTSIIYRTWLVKDPSGNQSSCIDTIYLERTGLDEINYPANWDGLPGNHDFIEACSGYKKDLNGNPHPDYTGAPSGPLCGNIMINYVDHKRIYLCGEGGKSYKVLREWIVMDMCTSEVYDTIQIIAIMDTKAPYVSISGLVNNTLTASTDDYSCDSDVELPLPRVKDCSNTTLNISYQLADENGNFPAPTIPFNTIQPSGGKYIIHDMPTGLARVKYIVTDDCGNATEKLIYVKVIDNLEPQAICDKHTTISLNDEGKGYLGKITFDDGSYDNCTDITMRVRRMTSSCDPSDTHWGEGVHFCCDDVSLTEPVMVQLEVTDENGFKNSCMAQVFVQDKQSPEIVCPSNGEVSCKFDYSDLSVFGTVRTSEEDVQKIYVNDPEHGGNHIYFGKDGYATDNCSVIIEELPAKVNINNCGTGIIQRSFRAQDNFGNKSNICKQIIKVIDFKPFNPKHDLIWPRDYTANGCLDSSIDPDNLPEKYGWPRITGDDKCSMIAMDKEDLVFEHIEGMCYKILRKWEVIDWCQYNQNDPWNTEGYWEHVQTLIINDNIAPVFTEGCSPSSITALGNCQYRVEFNAVANDNCTPEQHLKYSHKVELNNNPNDFVEGNGNSFNIVLSKGNHKIIWYAEDNCGNIGQCSQTFTITDDKAPTPQCLEGLVTVLLEETGRVTINAADFNRHSTDDCTASNYGTCGCLTDLKFSFSSNVNERTRLLTCDDIENGSIDTIELEMWVTDESGNQDFCNTFIVLQDNADVCPDVLPPHDTSYYNIIGNITNPDNEPLNNVDLTLITDNPEIPVSASSDEEGIFEFGNLADNYHYSVRASREGDDINGLSTLDIVYIQKHLLGIKDLNDPYKLIAADINNSGNISASDILELRKMILGEYNTFKNNHSWKFVPKNHEFENANIPYNYDPAINLGILTEDRNIGFTGVKIGDINNSAITSGNQLENRNSEEIDLIAEDIHFTKGQEIELPVFLANDKEIIGTQFTIKYNTSNLKYNGISNGLISFDKFNINEMFKENGLITVSWNTSKFINTNSGSPLFRIKFIAINNGNAKMDLDINSEITNAEIYTNESGGIKESKLKLEFRNSIDTYTFSVKQNVPNPFSETTTIGFEIPENQTVILSIYDITGKIVYQNRQEFDKGYNEITIDKKDLNATGLLYYKLEAGQYSAMKKMILIK